MLDISEKAVIGDTGLSGKRGEALHARQIMSRAVSKWRGCWLLRRLPIRSLTCDQFYYAAAILPGGRIALATR